MNHPATLDYTTVVGSVVAPSYQKKNGDSITADLKTVINSLLDIEFRHELQRTKHQIGSGFLMESLWKSYLLSFILNMDCTNDLIRKLQENPTFTEICGFNMDEPLPSRWTFDRFITTLTQHPEIIEKVIYKAVDQLKERLPDFGITVAVDSTPVKSHSNPKKREVSDKEAGFIVKESIPYKIWKWGYKLHLLVDTTWELPIACQVTIAKESDITNLIPLIEKAKKRFPWFKPWHVTADKGYDASYNYKAIRDMGSIPIIKMKEKAKGQEGRFTLDETGIPHCKSGFQLLLRSHTPEKGMQYICPFKAGKVECPSPCSLRVAWIRPLWEYRQLCPIPRESEEWNEIYSKRTAIERVNSRLKDKRRLNTHCHRGFDKVQLHSLMSVLSLLVTALAEVNDGHLERARTCTRMLS
jgi:hypothetical protein